jgi:hypothetical protein
MADCDDRQLTEAQREAGYQQGRTGVVRAVRPFSGRPTLPNLIDYINRELFPAVKSTRDRLNDVYLPVADNAPSGNPLTYYFDAATTAGDPTAGRIRLNASPEATATNIAVSETNARLIDSRPWLEVMAGGATTPLGVVTLSDAINPARFIRFDLNTMTDQGTYWDLGVTVIESSHDDPFVDGGGLVVSFIPGVASTGTTVPSTALTPITAQSVLGNPTSATAAPIAIALNDLSVLGRNGVLGTNVAGIDVPGTGTFTGESVFLRVASTRLAMQWRPWTLVDMPQASDNTFVGNISGATGRPTYTSLGLLSSPTVLYDNVGKTFIRETIDGDVYVQQNQNVSLIQPNAVTDGKLRDSGALSVIGRAANSTGDPADISATAGAGGVLRESGSTLGFGTIATAGIADGAVTNAKLANMNPGTVKGRQIDAVAGVPVDLTGLEVAELIRFGTMQNTTLSATTNDLSLNADTTVLRLTSTTGAQSLTGITGGAQGRLLLVDNVSFDGNPITLTSQDTGSAAANRFRTPRNLSVILGFRDSAILRWETVNGDWRVIAVASSPLTDGDKGDITVATSGTVWTIDNDVVSNAKLRDSGALSVIGRAANSTGDPADISATAASNAVLRESGSVLGFGTIATGGITDNAVTNAKLRDSGALSVIGRSANSSGDPADISATAASDAVLRESGSTLGFGTIATGGLANDAVTDAKLRNSGALSVIGRSANSAGDPADISATAASDAVLRESGSVLGFGTVATGGLANNAVTDAKLRQGGALTVIGRSANSTGNVADIAAVAASGAVLRESGSTIGFGTIATAGIADGAVTLAKMANLAAGTVIGRQIDASSGVPVALTGLELGENLRVGTNQDITIAATTNDQSLNADADVLRVTCTGSQSLTGITGGATGRLLSVENVSFSGNNLTLVSQSASSTAANRFRTPNGVDTVLRFRESALLRWDNTNGDWRVIALSRATGIADADYGDVTVTSAGTVWTIDANVVSDAKLRQSAALSVIGRSANSTGNVADISGTASSDAVLRVSGTTLGFGTVATAGIADNAVTDAKVRQGGACSVIGRSANTTGNVADISAGTNDRVLTRASDTLAFRQVSNDMIADGTIALGKIAGIGANTVIGNNTGATTNPTTISIGTNTVLGREGANIVAQQVATAQIADDAVTNAKLRNGGALSVIGRSANSTGDVADISATAASGAVLRESGSALGFGTIATAGIADAAVTLAKMADLAQSRIIGRAEGAGTGVPTALTPTQVAAIIDGEAITWTGTHSFNGANLNASTGSDIVLAAGGTTTLSGGTQVQVTSPFFMTSSISFGTVLTSSATAADNLVIGSISVARFTGPVDPLTGMVKAASGQVVLLVNAHASTNMGVHIESASSSAANRFAGTGTSRVIRPGEMGLAWYDDTSARWRLLLRDDIDL